MQSLFEMSLDVARMRPNFLQMMRNMGFNPKVVLSENYKVEYYNETTGEIRGEGVIIDGKKEGPFFVYDRRGVFSWGVLFTNDVLDGKFKLPFHPTLYNPSINPFYTASLERNDRVYEVEFRKGRITGIILGYKKQTHELIEISKLRNGILLKSFISEQDYFEFKTTEFMLAFTGTKIEFRDLDDLFSRSPYTLSIISSGNVTLSMSKESGGIIVKDDKRATYTRSYILESFARNRVFNFLRKETEATKETLFVESNLGWDETRSATNLSIEGDEKIIEETKIKKVFCDFRSSTKVSNFSVYDAVTGEVIKKGRRNNNGNFQGDILFYENLDVKRKEHWEDGVYDESRSFDLI